MWKDGQAWLGGPAVEDLCKCSITEQYPFKMQGEKERLPQLSYTTASLLWLILSGMSSGTSATGRLGRPGLSHRSQGSTSTKSHQGQLSLWRGELGSWHMYYPFFSSMVLNAGWWQHSVPHKTELATLFLEGIKKRGPVWIYSFRNKLWGKRDWEI